jgi:predicted RNase H-like nuclease (RuvC/YqgF family)
LIGEIVGNKSANIGIRKRVTTMQNENAESLDYKAEYQREVDMNCFLRNELEDFRREIYHLQEIIHDKDYEIHSLKGQVKAFEFCISRGNTNAE